MKKLNYLLLGAAALLMASCSQEDLQNNSVANGEGNVTFKVTIPKNITTRTIGDGKSATQLQVVVFDAPADGTLTYVLDADAEFDPTSNTANVNLNLVTGKNYQIAFFAASEDALAGGDDAVYSIDTQTGVLNVNYSAMTSDNNNEDAYDCFSANYTTGKISGAINETITLYRPVAQINWGTTGLTANSTGSNYEDIFGPNGQYMLSTLEANLYQSLNLLTGVYSNQETVTLSDFAAPSTTQGTFPTIGTSSYNYVAMQYILAPSTSSIVDLTLTISNTGEGNPAETFTNDIVVTSAPVQANFQTNIYGNLLTGNVSFNVIKNNWDENSPHNVAVWDGATTSAPTLDESTNTYTINNPGEWVWLTKNVTDVPGEIGRINKNVVLNADLDFAGFAVQGVYFFGTFNGNGHTIKNLTITPKSSYASGFFGNDISVGAGTVTIENLTFDNVTITNHDSANGWIGVVVGDIQTNNFVLNNITVNNANLSGVNSVGGLVGFVSGGKSLTVNGCTVSNSTISNIPVENESGNVCGMVGRVVGSATFGSGNTVENTVINGYWTTKRGIDSINEVAYNAAGTSGTITGQSGVETVNNTVNKYQVTTDVTVNGNTYDTLADALAAAPSGSNINLGIGTYNIPAQSTFAPGMEYTFTGSGAEYTLIQYPLNYVASEDSQFTFSNLTLQAWNSGGTSMGFQEATSVTMTNCDIIGEFHAFGGNCTFTGCSFTQNPDYNQTSGRYSLWIESRTPGTTTVTDCTFENFLAKGILVYDNSSNADNLSTMGNIDITGCSFTASAPYKTNAAIEIHSEYFKSAGTLTINNTTYNDNYSALWIEKINSTGVKTNFFKVVVNGQIVQTGGQIAE